MSNSSTKSETPSLQLKGRTRIEKYLVTYDTSGADLTIATPDSGYFLAIVGMQYSDDTAHNITFKSGSTSLVTLYKAANSGVDFPLSNRVFVNTKVDEALKINCSIALDGGMIIYVAQAKEINLA